MLISYANLKGHQNSAPACEDFKVNLNRAAVGEVSFTPTGRVAVVALIRSRFWGDLY